MSNNCKEARAPLANVFISCVPSLLFLGLILSLYHVPLPWTFVLPWVPSLNVDLDVYIDGLSAQFLLLITGIGSLVFFYARGYLAGHPKAKRLFILLVLFLFAMIGAVVSDNLLVLFVFWELTSVLSFLLVGFNHEDVGSRKSAQQAILVTGAGGLFLLAGFILLGEIAGTYSIQAFLHSPSVLINDSRLGVVLVLIFVGAFTKSAQFPFHFWLPNAMAAPTPVSAYLHSATMVKLGIYLLARLDTAFSDIIFWEYALVGTGTLTAVFAAVQTVYERDLKRILAWSTIATLGTLVMLVGLPGHGAALATVALFFAHALYKAPLFFVAGNLDHGAGTREIDKLTGMRHYMPWTATAALVAALSMAGLPLTFGFVAKDAISFAKAQAEVLHLVSYATVFVNVVSVAVAAIAAIHIFWGHDTIPRKSHPHEAPASMIIPPLMLVLCGIVFGLAPTLIDPLLGAAAKAMSPEFDATTVNMAYDLAPVIEVTLGTIALGLLVYLRWDWLHERLSRITFLEKVGPEGWYLAIMDTLPVIAARLTRIVQHGILPRYLMTMLVTVAVLLLVLLTAADPPWLWPPSTNLGVPVASASLLIIVGGLAACFVRDHLVLLLVGGLVGFGSAVLFMFTGAPDLALTQFFVETVFVVVVATVLVKLRRLKIRDRQVPLEPLIRPLDLFVAMAFSLIVVVLTLLVSALPFDAQLTDFYATRSLAEAHGRNVVNLILVDFRALDTLGEISVLFFSLIAVLPLLKRIGDKRP
ncbi:MAG: DUF4040 domain-containing protein [Deltaproteobacteria bacterium]|nr:DUF4040 domain-containing protein [Deltaproteobacteria bacterium]